MHSTYSDGSASVGRMAASAAEKGLKTIAITDHMPLPFPTRYAMDRHRMDAYQADIRAAGQAHDLTVLAGLEMEYIPRFRGWIRDILDQAPEGGWDMRLVSIHNIVTDRGNFMINGRQDEFDRTLKTVFKDDIRAFCTHYYALIREAAATGWFDAVGHLDVIKKHNRDNCYFDERSDWYGELIDETLDSLAGHGLKMEINTNGLNHPAGAFYPSGWIQEKAIKKGIPLILGSDAHSPARQGQYFDRAGSPACPAA